MLQSQMIDIKFATGADTKTDDKNTIYTSFRELKNARMDRIGAVRPRGGLTLLEMSSGTTQAFDIQTNGPRTVYGGNNNLSVLTPSQATSSVISESLRGTLERLYGGDARKDSISIESTNGLICMVWLEDGVAASTTQIGILILNATTLQVVLHTVYTNAFALRQIRVVKQDTRFFVFMVDVAYDMSIKLLSTTSLSSPFTSVTWAAAPLGVTEVRFAAQGDASGICLASSLNNSVNVDLQLMNVSLLNVVTSVSTASVLTFAGAARCVAISISSSLAGIRCAVFAGQVSTSAKGAIFNSSAVMVGSVQTIAVSAGTEFHRCSAYEDSTAAFPMVYRFGGLHSVSLEYEHGTIQLDGSSSSSSSSGNIYPAQFLTGAIRIDSILTAMSETFCSLGYGSQALVNATTLVGTRLGGLGASGNFGSYELSEYPQLPNPVQSSTRTFYACLMVTAINSIVPVATGSATFEETTLRPKIQATMVIHDTAEHPTSIIDSTNRQNLYLSATQNQLTSYDRGAGVWPELVFDTTNDLSVVSPGAFTRSAGVVSYVFAKLWKSADGLEYRTYSPIYTATTAANATMQTRVATMQFKGNSAVGPEITIEQYRTEVNGTIFYLANLLPYTASTTTYSDTSVDGVAGILQGRLADINGGELPPELPMSARLVTAYKDRIAMVSADRPSVILFNRPAPFPVGTSFASGLDVDVGSSGGNIRALVQMDSALYAFKSNSVYTLYGEPPAATGENGTLTVPQLLFNGTGCTDPRSAILTPKGIIFKSGKGFHLIARNQMLSFIGEGPYADNSQRVVGSAIAESQAEVMFTFSSGSIWVLNLETSSWYEWTSSEVPRAITASDGSVYLAVDRGVIAYSTSNIVDFIGNPAAFVDVPLDVVTGWLKFDHIRGFQRVKRLYLEGDIINSCTLTIDVYVDYIDTAVQTLTVAASTVGRLQVDLHMSVQKCEAMSFRIRTNKNGIRLSGATVEIGSKEGPDKSRTSSSNLS